MKRETAPDILNLMDIASRLCGCVELLSLLSMSAEKTMISARAVCSICDLLTGIYKDLQTEIDPDDN